jgi:DNA-binding MarR family transcriptional regulator
MVSRPPPRLAGEQSVVLAPRRATHVTLHVLAAGLVELEPAGSEINALANLSDGQGRTVSQLGAAVGARPTTLTSVLDRLERHGHITRGTRAGDRRSVLIKLTASGLRAAAMIRRTLADPEPHALDGLPPEAVDGFHRSCEP